ncbi:Sentrin-specific protease 2, partial [Orchesella cincta]
YDFQAVLDFVRMEATARKQIDLLNSLDTWRVLTEERWPRQNNINDCGIFLCLYAEALSLRAPPIFNTKFMNLQRVKIMIELLQSSLEEPNYDLSYYVNDAKKILKQGSRQLGWMPGVTYID